MDKFNGKYRIPSARLQSWDYGSNGGYFITICTKNREHFFGHISGDEMHLNELGKLAKKYWIEIPAHFSFIELGEFVVMPNHVHGILIINKMDDSIIQSNVEKRLIASLPPSQPAPTNKTPGGITGNKNPMLNENISRAIRWYKGVSSFEMRKINSHFAWQARFHDHIIRDAQSFETIQNYIANNPRNWDKDKFFGIND